MTRLGIDPWIETARLAAMPSALAVETLTSVLRRVPNLSWAEKEIQPAVVRLVGLVPGPDAGRRENPSAQQTPRPEISLGRALTRLGLVGFASLILLGWMLSRPNVLGR